MGGLGILLGNLITTQKSCYIILPYKFMSGFLYFSNNLKYIKDHIQTDVISYKIFFQLMVTVSKEKLNLQLPRTFYSSIRFAFETAFISEQIAENSFGAWLEISDKFFTKFNVFSQMILKFRLKTVWKNSKPYCITLKTVARQFCLKGHRDVRDELLEMGKDLKIKHSVSSPPAKMAERFLKKALHGAKFLEGCFTWGLIIRSCKRKVNG